MCLAIPGQLICIHDDTAAGSSGTVRFGAVLKEVNLFCTPEARVGDYVIVHAGLAITVLDEEEARAVLDTVAALDQ
ncbi:MAG: hypothetical protein RLZZ226_1505 [Pseudomonadota bacterium]|jgi:hydrogenase expression/formation protein HypC